MRQNLQEKSLILGLVLYLTLTTLNFKYIVAIQNSLYNIGETPTIEYESPVIEY